MFYLLRSKILKRIYKFLIYKVTLLNKQDLADIEDFDLISNVVVKTNRGEFVFEFRLDKNASYRPFRERFLTINIYLLSLKVPEQLRKINETLSNKVLLAVKFALIKPNLKILAELLIDLYIDKALLNANK